MDAEEILREARDNVTRINGLVKGGPDVYLPPPEDAIQRWKREANEVSARREAFKAEMRAKEAAESGATAIDRLVEAERSLIFEVFAERVVDLTAEHKALIKEAIGIVADDLQEAVEAIDKHVRELHSEIAGAHAEIGRLQGAVALLQTRLDAVAKPKGVVTIDAA